MPRKQKKYHFIYRTTNLLNEKFYVGMHSTDNLEDGYVGSGKRLGYSIRKYGLENHKFEILEFLSSREELKKREAEVVNEELLADPLCMNLKFGGAGGWDHTKSMDLTARAKSLNEKRSEKIATDPLFAKSVSQAAKNAYDLALFDVDKMMKIKEEKHGSSNCWLGKQHTEESKAKMRKPKNQGRNNSQFGTCWINNGVEVKKIKSDELHLWEIQGWRKGRKLVFPNQSWASGGIGRRASLRN